MTIYGLPKLCVWFIGVLACAHMSGAGDCCSAGTWSAPVEKPCVAATDLWAPPLFRKLVFAVTIVLVYTNALSGQSLGNAIGVSECVMLGAEAWRNGLAPFSLRMPRMK